MKKRDIYDITLDEVLGYVEQYNARFSVLLSKRPEVFADVFGAVPSWLRFQTEMVRRKKSDLLGEIEDLDHRFWANKTEDNINMALASNDIERLKALQLAMQIMVGQGKLDNGNETTTESQPTAMTINISGLKGKESK